MGRHWRARKSSLTINARSRPIWASHTENRLSTNCASQVTLTSMTTLGESYLSPYPGRSMVTEQGGPAFWQYVLANGRWGIKVIDFWSLTFLNIKNDSIITLMTKDVRRFPGLINVECEHEKRWRLSLSECVDEEQKCQGARYGVDIWRWFLLGFDCVPITKMWFGYLILRDIVAWGLRWADHGRYGRCSCCLNELQVSSTTFRLISSTSQESARSVLCRDLTTVSVIMPVYLINVWRWNGSRTISRILVAIRARWPFLANRPVVPRLAFIWSRPLRGHTFIASLCNQVSVDVVINDIRTLLFFR